MKNQRRSHSAGMRLLGILLALVMVVGFLPATRAAAADDDPPPPPTTNKLRTSNGDGTYKLELSVKGDSEIVETAASVNVLIVYDVSSSMTSNNVTANRNRADYAEDVMHDFVDALRAKQNPSDRSNVEAAVVNLDEDMAKEELQKMLDILK